MGIHYLAWVDNLDARTEVLIQRHEDWVAAGVNSSMYSSERRFEFYITGYNKNVLKAFAGVSPRGALARLRIE